MDEIFDISDLRAINTQDLISFGEPPTTTLSDLENMLDLGSCGVGNGGGVGGVGGGGVAVEDEPPQHWNSFPHLEAVQTGYDFDIHIDTAGEKLNWLYSAKLDKVYIKLNSMMNMTVSYVPNMNEPLFVRAMIVFSRRDEMPLPVTRCPNHRMLSCDIPSFHILKCCNPGTEYHGTENEKAFGRRASLVVPMAPTQQLPNELGRCQQSLGLEFLCQNSCANGIQRKQTVLVFTLENERRQILGKRVMHFKVCSCPKRDMGKEMNTAAAPPQRKRPATGPPAGVADPHPNAVGGGKHLSKMICLQTPTGQSPLLAAKQELSPANTGTTASPCSDLQSPPLSEHNSSSGGGGGGGGDAVHSLSASIDQFRFDGGGGGGNQQRSPDTEPMSSPPADANGLSPFALSLVMPTRESALHVLRCAYNEVTGSMARDKTNSMKYIPYARQLEQFANDNNMQL